MGKREIVYTAGALTIGILIGAALRGPSLEAQTPDMESRAVQLQRLFQDQPTAEPTGNQQDIETRVQRLEDTIRDMDSDMSWMKMDIRALFHRVAVLESRIRTK